ncbi:MAG: type IVB secretion system coupling complex protein DotM/IcmP [Legionellales bacterium]|nr:type IVB secretion system coupling complex protein DotM/IcmP [Legionellales bacterium]
MPPAGGGGGGQQNDSSLSTLWVVSALVIGALVLWYTAHAYLTAILFKIRLGEIAVVSLFSSSLNGVHDQIIATSPASASFTTVANISTQVGQVLMIPFAIFLGALAIVLYRVSSANRYRRVHSMQSLMDQEKNNWPQISVVTNLNLLQIHIHEGPWAMSMTPMQFAKKHKLLTEERVADSTGLASRSRIVVKVDEPRATQIFTRQLGRQWKGIDKLPPYSRALFGIFAAKVNADRTTANKVIKAIAASAGDLSKIDFSSAEVLLTKHADTKIVKKIIESHAYELTAMASLLEVARLDGILAAADFLWLKPLDRSLWYMLNNVGRRTAFTEVAGAYAHWLAERAIGRKLLVPMVSEATIALVAALEEIVFNPDQDY